MDREVLLADAVKRRDQRHHQRGVPDGKQAAPNAVDALRVAPACQATIADQVGDADRDQRDQ
jgi:hypothetical protein